MDALIEAIGEVESGNNDQVIGTAGEVSRFQITPALWREHTVLPTSCAHIYANARIVARRILYKWQATLRARGVPDSIIAHVLVQWWACGPHGVPTEEKRDEMLRITNIYRELKR
jgi:hypothetical protein